MDKVIEIKAQDYEISFVIWILKARVDSLKLANQQLVSNIISDIDKVLCANFGWKYNLLRGTHKVEPYYHNPEIKIAGDNIEKNRGLLRNGEVEINSLIRVYNQLIPNEKSSNTLSRYSSDTSLAEAWERELKSLNVLGIRKTREECEKLLARISEIWAMDAKKYRRDW